MRKWVALFVIVLVFSYLSIGVDTIWQSHSDVFSDDEVLRCAASKLKQSVVVPHMHVPIEDRNILWCGTFQLAWNEACELVGDDLRFAPAEPALVAHMNRKEFTGKHLDAASYVAVADYVKNDVHGKIARALQKKFKGQAAPKHIPPRTDTPRPQDIVTYCYLFKNLEFEVPFERIERPLVFGKTNVSCFGMGEEHKPGHAKLLGLFTILDQQGENDFVLELKTKSKGDRVILAKIPPAKTLALTVSAVCKRVAVAEPVEPRLGDVLKIPKFNLDITRTFAEIEGKRLVVKNPKVAKDLVILSALQNIRFQMDEKGIRLKSESHVSFGCSAPDSPERRYVLIFDKPFLLLLQQKDAKCPYFAAWIDNPELLVGAK